MAGLGLPWCEEWGESKYQQCGEVSVSSRPGIHFKASQGGPAGADPTGDTADTLVQELALESGGRLAKKHCLPRELDTAQRPLWSRLCPHPVLGTKTFLPESRRKSCRPLR